LSLNRILALLDHVPNYAHDKDVTNQLARSSLVRTQTSLTTIIADLREHTERLSLIREEEAFKKEDIQMEANRLKAVFKSMNSGPTNNTFTKNPELGDICALLEREAASRERGAAPTDLLQNFLQDLDGQDDNFGVFLETSAVDVDAEISHAICLDQIAILQTYETGLDQVLFIQNPVYKSLWQLLRSFFFFSFRVRPQILLMSCSLR